MKNILITITLATLMLLFGSLTFAQDEERDLQSPNSGKKTKQTPASKTVSAKNTKKNPTSNKKVVAVLNFDDASLGNKELLLGKLLVASLTKELTKSKTFEVTERQQIESVMNELNISFDEAIDPKTAAKVGKQVAANTAVFGTITEFNLVNEEVSVLGVKRIRYTATVGLNIRLVDINTGIILKSVESTETAKKDSYGTFIISTETKETNDFRIKLFTEAADKAVKNVVKQLSPIIQNSDSPQLASQPTSTESTKTTPQSKPASTDMTRTLTSSSDSSNSSAKVSRVIKEIVYLSGLGDVKIGDILSVVRGSGAGKEIAVIEITEVNERTAKAKIIQGSGIQADDRVKIIQ